MTERNVLTEITTNEIIGAGAARLLRNNSVAVMPIFLGVFSSDQQLSAFQEDVDR